VQPWCEPEAPPSFSACWSAKSHRSPSADPSSRAARSESAETNAYATESGADGRPRAVQIGSGGLPFGAEQEYGLARGTAVLSRVETPIAMSADPNKKSARTFQCRDVLWGTFEQMAHELECSVDYLINEAMKQYARQRSHDGSRTPYPVPGREPSEDRVARSPSSPANARLPGAAPLSPSAPSGGGRMPAPPARSPGPPMPAASRGPLPPPPPGRPTSPAVPAAARSTLPPAPRTAPPPLPRAPAPPAVVNGYPSNAVHGTSLSLTYQGERHQITKDRFVIGRGKQSSDLTLKDPNVSRQHAMIEFQNGVYFIVDMGSTNGIEYNGQRIARKQIAEGDVFRICDHELSFTFR
jgi:FHA domain